MAGSITGSVARGLGQRRWLRYGRTAARITLLAVLLAFALVRPLLLEPFFVPSASMSPLLEPNDRILVDKLSYRIGEPARYEVVVFYGSDAADDPDAIYVKRIIGLPGEEVAIRGGRTYIEGVPLAEPYLRSRPFSDFGPTVVPRGEVFVMGDNRNDSRDSRFWGAVPVSRLIGHAVLVFWPPRRMRRLP